MKPEPCYVGDSVYIRVGGWGGQYVIYTYNGIDVENEIYIEEPMLEAILSYIKRIKENKG